MTLYLDPAPLLAAVGEGTNETLATVLGVTRETVERWRAGKHKIHHTTADRLAIATGHTPYELWPELVELAVASVEKNCARCGRPFLPNRSFQKYCRSSCRVANLVEQRPKVEPTERSCAWCGQPFMSIRASHVRCSQACNRAARYEAHADDERAYQRDYNARYRARQRTAA
jgi:transcriptional regulator with XRE-family HTH domain